MEYQKLGLTDLEVSRIGFGCWAIGGHGYGNVDDSESIKAIHKALDLGINFFDTADVYGFGHSEEILSKALCAQKDKVVIATKFGVAWDQNGKTFKDCRPKRLVKALEDSLMRLKLDCIPLYQVHWQDGKTLIEDVMEALLKCRDAGKIRYIGCSNLPLNLIERASRISHLASIQSHFNIAHQENELFLRDCYYGKQIGTIAYGVLARGLFSGKYDNNSSFGANDTRSNDEDFKGVAIEKNLNIVKELEKVGRQYQKTPSQVAIRWVLDTPFVTCCIIGAKSPSHVVTNIGAIGWQMDKVDLQFLSSLSMGQIGGNDGIH